MTLYNTFCPLYMVSEPQEKGCGKHTEMRILETSEHCSSDKTKVAHLHTAVQREENVGRFQVSVHHPLLVDIKHSI